MLREHIMQKHIFDVFTALFTKKAILQVIEVNRSLPLSNRVLFPFYSDEYIFVLCIYGSASYNSYFSGIVSVYDRHKTLCCERDVAYKFWLEHDEYLMIVGSKHRGVRLREFTPVFHDHEEFLKMVAQYKEQQKKGGNK